MPICAFDGCYACAVIASCRKGSLGTSIVRSVSNSGCASQHLRARGPESRHRRRGLAASQPSRAASPCVRLAPPAPARGLPMRASVFGNGCFRQEPCVLLTKGAGRPSMLVAVLRALLGVILHCSALWGPRSFGWGLGVLDLAKVGWALIAAILSFWGILGRDQEKPNTANLL